MFGRGARNDEPWWGVEGGDLFVQRPNGTRSYHGNNEAEARRAFNDARRGWFDKGGGSKSGGGWFGSGSSDSNDRGWFG